MKIADKDFTIKSVYDDHPLNKVRVTSFRVVRRIGSKIPPKMFIATLPK